MTKLCKDCKHCYTSILTFGFNFAECKHPNNYIIDIISGKKEPIYTYCSTQRIGTNDSKSCCIEGKWFEQKEPTWLDKLKTKFKF